MLNCINDRIQPCQALQQCVIFDKDIKNRISEFIHSLSRGRTKTTLLGTHVLRVRRKQTNHLLYRVYKKQLNRFEIALNSAKQLLVSSF
jgi:hypothetical protein